MTSWQINQTEKFSLSLYAQTVFELLGQPRKFYGRLPQSIALMPILGFLTVSAVLSSLANALNTGRHNVYLAGGIHLLNAFGMVLIMAGLGYMVMTLCIGKKMPFARMFAIYVLSSGVTLLVSWIPYFALLAEPWKWYLIAIGLTKGCGLKLKEALLIIVLSLAVWTLFFWSLMPIIAS